MVTKSKLNGARCSDQLSVVDLLPNQLVLTQRVACFTGYHVDGTFIHLLLDGSEQHKKWFTGTFLYTNKHADFMANFQVMVLALVTSVKGDEPSLRSFVVD